MQIAAHTMATPGYTLSEALASFENLGYDGAEIIRADDYVCGISTTTSLQECEAVARELADRNLEIANLVPYTNQFNVPDGTLRRRAIDDMRASITQAVSLGSPGVRVLAGVPAEIGEEEAYRSRLVESLHELAEWAGQAGVTLYLENHVQSLAVSASVTTQIVREVASSHLRILYDAANLHIMGDTDHRAGLRQQLPFIGHVHVKDIFSLGGERKEARLLGEGEVDWAWILPALVDGGYDRWCTSELEKRWYPDQLPSSEIALRRELATMKQLLLDTIVGG